MSLVDQPQAAPSTAAIVFASLLVGAIGGYFFGAASSIGIFSSPAQQRSSSRAAAATGTASDKADQTSEDSDEEDEDDDQPPGELASFATSNEEFKMTLVVRTDLGMTKGKIAAQCSHATLANFKSLQRSQPSLLKAWECRGQAKVALQVRSMDELDLLYGQALSVGLCANVIHDAGRTQIAAGSATVLAVGPGPRSVVDGVTGALKLL